MLWHACNSHSLSQMWDRDAVFSLVERADEVWLRTLSLLTRCVCSASARTRLRTTCAPCCLALPTPCCVACAFRHYPPSETTSSVCFVCSRFCSSLYLVSVPHGQKAICRHGIARWQPPMIKVQPSFFLSLRVSLSLNVSCRSTASTTSSRSFAATLVSALC